MNFLSCVSITKKKNNNNNNNNIYLKSNIQKCNGPLELGYI